MALSPLGTLVIFLWKQTKCNNDWVHSFFASSALCLHMILVSQDLEVEESGQKGYSVPKIVFRKTAVMLLLIASWWGYQGSISLPFSWRSRIQVSQCQIKFYGPPSMHSELGMWRIWPHDFPLCCLARRGSFHRVLCSVEVRRTRPGRQLGWRMNP